MSNWKYPDFEDWYNELLTHTLRSEWLESRSEELKAAFEAGREISTEGIDNTEN